MRIERDIHSSRPESELRERAAAHLLAAGYRQTSDGVEMAFTRGSILSSILSFSARGCMAQVYLRPRAGERAGETETQLEAVFIVSTAGRVVTKGERRFWESEADKLEVAVAGEAATEENRETASPEMTSPESLPYAGRIPAEYSSVARRSPAPAAQMQIALIYATLAALFCLITGWEITHSLPGAIIGLLIGIGVAFVLTGVWMSRFEKGNEAMGDGQ